MNKTFTIMSIILITKLLASCSEKTQTVKWYVEHPEILKKEVEKCKTKTLAELATDKHCTVIRQAQQEAFDEQQRNAPIPTFK